MYYVLSQYLRAYFPTYRVFGTNFIVAGEKQKHEIFESKINLNEKLDT